MNGEQKTLVLARRKMRRSYVLEPEQQVGAFLVRLEAAILCGEASIPVGLQHDLLAIFEAANAR